MNSPVLSLVVPAYNEEDSAPVFLKRIFPILKATEVSFEIVFVDDGSQDRTVELIAGMNATHPEVKLVTLSRNFGKEAALTAGLSHASGQAIIPIDCDLQDPPELIPEMLNLWRSGYQVVYAQRRSRNTDSWLKKGTATLFYKVLQSLTHIHIPKNVGDYRLMDRRAVDALLAFPERNRFMKGLAASVGFKQTAIMFDREPRVAGHTKWNYWKLWNFALDGITSFSTLPLRIWTYLGAMVALSAFVFAGWTIAKTLIWGVVTPGYATMISVVLLLGGLQMIGLGVIGEYVGRIVAETKQRPLYFVADRIGWDPDHIVAPSSKVHHFRRAG